MSHRMRSLLIDTLHRPSAVLLRGPASRTLRIVLLAALATSCGDTDEDIVSQLNLTRPTDIAFACYGGLRITNGSTTATVDQPIDNATAQPIASCDIRSGDPINSQIPLPPGQEDLQTMGGAPIASANYFAFILQPTVGTVAVATWTPKPSTAFTGADVTVIDSDPLTPGTNSITIGENPIALATDVAGCFEVTANAGSCDMSELQINSALDTNPGTQVNRKDVVNSAGVAIRAKPAAMVAEPPGGTIGVECPATATGLVFIAYPSCHAVAVVDAQGAATATVISTIVYDASGVPTLGGPDLTCPDECGSSGGAITPGIRPTSLDLQQDPRTGVRRLLVGAENSSALTLVELDPVNSHPTSLRQIALEDKTKNHNLGVISVAISPQIGMGGEPMPFGSGLVNDTTAAVQDQFAYAVATDTTIRVAEILNLGQECDTQVDPRFIDNEHDIGKLSCFPVGDPATPARRAGAISPGIAFPGKSVPTSIAIVRADAIPGDTRISPATSTIYEPPRMVGYFGIVGAENGAIFVINIDDDNFFDSDDQPRFIDASGKPSIAPTLASPIPMDIANQVRDGVPDRNATSSAVINGVGVPECDVTSPDPDDTAGVTAGPRSPDAPTKTVPTGTFGAAKVNNLPDIRHVLCVGQDDPNVIVSELDFKAPPDVRGFAFPDLRALRADETFTVTWEGSLSESTSASEANGPAIRSGQLSIDNVDQMRLDDASRPYCSAGIEPWDSVQLRGCDPSVGDVDCPIGYSCFVHPQSTVVGLGACILTDEAPRLQDACKEFLISLRRYTVATATSGELVLLPRKNVLRTTPVDGCTSVAQCSQLATYALQSLDSINPESEDPANVDNHNWACEVDPLRAPIGGTGKRCIETCMTDTDCDAGTVCENQRCMEGVIPPQACVNAPQRYDMRSHDAFTVVGTISGYIHPIIEDATGTCVTDPTASPWQVGRIPLAAPACDPMENLLTGKRSDGTIEPNPCSLTTDDIEVAPTFAVGPGCVVASLGTHEGLAAGAAVPQRWHAHHDDQPDLPGRSELHRRWQRARRHRARSGAADVHRLPAHVARRRRLHPDDRADLAELADPDPSRPRPEHLGDGRRRLPVDHDRRALHARQGVPHGRQQPRDQQHARVARSGLPE